MRRRFMSDTGFKESFDYNNYMTIEALEDDTAVSFVSDIEYGIDGQGWRRLPYGSKVIVNAGQFLSFKGEFTPNTSNIPYYGIGTFTISKNCNLVGNCMSMLFGDNAVDNFSLEGKTCAFYGLFKKCPVINVSSEFLPATALAISCYSGMFEDCTSLTTAPELPATTLANYCYQNMFNGCTNLTTAPELPATTLAYGCYNSMFSSCTSLISAPELPATTLADGCYGYMFEGCSGLTTVPTLPATTLVKGCYAGMFRSCTSLTTAPKLPATTLVENCYINMFEDCTSLTTAPELPATTLANYCYQNMFEGCSGLTTVPTLPATTLVKGCYSGMFRSCTSLISAPELPATTLAYGCYGYMFEGCTKLNYIKMLATDVSADYCLYNWVNGVASTGTFVKNPAMTTLPTGTHGIPEGWTVVNDGEESGGSVMPIVLNAANSSMGNYTTPPSDNPNAKKLYEELMLLSNNTGEGNLDVGLVTLYLTHPGITGGVEKYCDVTSYSLAPSYIAEGILLYKEDYSYYVLQQDGTIKSVFYD